MIDDHSFVPPEITNDDIHWASDLLNLPKGSFFGSDGNDPRQDVIKSMEQIDVTACPGSGKTTLLVAKLAILAKKWNCQTRGVCVLSHTNAARNEIELKLGAAGRSLLSYPHYIGTIHGFVNEYLAIPWLRTKGYPIKMINTDVCLRKRWNELPLKTRIGLERNHCNSSILSVKSPDFDLGEVHWGKKGILGKSTDTYIKIQDACKKICGEGYFCYDEMFIWGNDMMDVIPGAAAIIRDRFPLLFVDEAQDNSENQSSILHRIFIDGDCPSICQRFGDPNQAIFDSVSDSGASTYVFPDPKAKKDLSNSYRFGQTIANLADPLGLEPYGLQGLGPKKPLESGLEGKHTIFLFNDDSIDNVMSAYAKLLIDTFSKKELQEGMFWAVGQVHRPPANEDTSKMPQCVGDYWSGYDSEVSGSDPKPQRFVQYFSAGQGKSKATGESHFAVEKIAEGIIRLAGIINTKFSGFYRKYNYRHVLRLLENNSDIKDSFEKLVVNLAIERFTITEETWNNDYRDIVLQIAKTIADVSETNSDADSFLKWSVYADDNIPTSKTKQDNIFSFRDGEKGVPIRVGSIHSIKGETHYATLILETYWQDKKGKHNLELLFPWLTGCKNGKCNEKITQQKRLKIHYVAMTRPRHLLCLAMKKCSVVDASGNLDISLCKKLKRHGWDIKCV